MDTRPLDWATCVLMAQRTVRDCVVRAAVRSRSVRSVGISRSFGAAVGELTRDEVSDAIGSHMVLAELADSEHGAGCHRPDGLDHAHGHLLAALVRLAFDAREAA
jgi:hypothetical protein